MPDSYPGRKPILKTGRGIVPFFSSPVILFCMAFMFLRLMAACSCGRTDRMSPSESDSLAVSGEISTLEDTLHLMFSGDYMQHLPQIISAQTPDGSYDYRPTLIRMKPFFESVDFAVMNLETTISEGGYTGFPMFRSPRASVVDLRDAGIDVLVMANNHCCDNGAYGIRHTVAVVDSCGFLRTGVYPDSADYRAHHPLILQKGKLRVALLNYTFSTNGLPVPEGSVVNRIDTVLIAGDIAQAKQMHVSDIIVFYHWGEEYAPHPGSYQKKIAEWTLRHGVSLIIGSHPHVIQPFSVVTNDSVSRITLFSLGNFISNQPEPASKGGMSFFVDLAGNGSRRSRVGNPRYLLHWVSSEWKEGKRHFQVIPVFVADTLLEGSTQYPAYLNFRDSARKLIGMPEGIREVTDYP